MFKKTKKDKTPHKDKSTDKTLKGSEKTPRKEKLLFGGIIIVILIALFGFIYAQSLEDINENIRYLDERTEAPAVPPSPPETQRNFSVEGNQLEHYIERAEDDAASNTDRAGAYINATLLAAKINDDRAASLANETLELIDGPEFNIGQDMRTLLQGVAEGDYSESLLERYAPTIRDPQGL